MKGNPQQGSAESLSEAVAQQNIKIDAKTAGSRPEVGGVVVDADQVKLLQQAQRVEFGAMRCRHCLPSCPENLRSHVPTA